MNIEEICVSPETSIMKMIKVLDSTHKKIIIVTEDGILKGVVTDGDIRRWLLQSKDLEAAVSNIMTMNPIYVLENERYNADKLMVKYLLDAIPVVDKNYLVIDVVFRYEGEQKKQEIKEKLETPVIIMAGGRGSRLQPLTQILPKPLIPIGNETILEQVIHSFTKYGCNNFYLTLNYKKNLIKAYINDLELNYSIRYIEEEKFLGTAGCLYLLKGIIESTFFVSNCDILLDVDYVDVLKYHKKNENIITLVVSLKNFIIPYGVINTGENGIVKGLQEKPELNFLVNTGVYVLEPQTLCDIPQEQFFDITELIDRYISEGKKVGIYPITEKSWEDMGEMNSMYQMLAIRGEQ